MRNKKIVVPIVNRTNYSKLRSILRYIKDSLEVRVILTSGAAVKDLTTIRDDIHKDGLTDTLIMDSCLQNDSHGAMTKNIALSMIQYSTFLEQENPDLALIVGDRFDMLAYAASSAIQNTPIAHIQGGERSGTIDDKIRFSITALSDYHFPSSEGAKKNVLNCGADSEKVFNFGCPAVEHIAQIKRDSKFSFDDLKKYSKRNLKGLRDTEGYILVQVHPNTVDLDDVNMEELLSALNEIDMPSIILYPNIDATNKYIVGAMRKYKDVDKFYYFRHFSLPIFIGLMNNASCVIGNSSSIIRESSLFKIPAINLGLRQSSRETNSNVFSCSFAKDDVLNLYNQIKDKKFDGSNLYYEPESSRKIADKIISLLNE